MNTFFRILTYLRAYRFRLAGAFICSVGVAGLSAVYAMLVQPVLDEIFIARNRELLLLLPLAVLAVALLKGAFAYGQAYLMSYIGHWLVADVRQQLFLHIIRLPIRFHDANSSGRLVARVISDVNEMANAIPSVLKDLFQQGLTFVALLGVAFYHNWKLASVVVFVLPFSGFVLMRVGKRIRKLSNRGQEHIGRMASVLKEAFSGIKIVKAYGQEDSELERFSLTNSAFRLAKVKSSQTSAMASPLLEVIGVCGVSVIIWFGGGQVIEGAMKPGEFFSFLSAMFMAYAPVRKMSGANESVQRALAGAQRVFSVLDLDSEMAKDEGKDTLKPITRTLEFENVTFVYEDAGEPALNHVNLSIHAGEVVAFVGASGSGKTTLVSLVPRFYRPTEGTLKIDGVDIRTVERASLRRQIGIVSQETVLFDDTIRNNIAYGRPNASDEAVVGASQAAFAWEFIERLPNGLDTLIGENGLKLSGGQRQRLAIARAILRDPPILILDEATSALDSESEKLVQQALANLMKGRTTLVIAHRLSTVQHADRIVVMAKGTIQEVGTHVELLQRGGLYTKLYQTQFQLAQFEPIPAS
ncbi:MAG: lipid A export permease/ATP-binding protein MsbA [Nitrospirales bacterium]|nr:lipid A export permease/ATP-binding protein MsbA [Nitrospira sp.]MCA9479402.1 lipid A export permease/ATP-binding protein MsbA [Nitrospira sp.]MCB9711323.1 lipid A export permease/ATP-binding protein MsbA [Nitrospiraceae bacterium]MDR4486359.1 lipid A export permease/ATP-binding protein MsbA [Nitrospirales bacterium]